MSGGGGGLRSQRQRVRHQVQGILRLCKGGLWGQEAAHALMYTVAEHIANATPDHQQQLLEQLETAVNQAIERHSTARLVLEGRVAT